MRRPPRCTATPPPSRSPRRRNAARCRPMVPTNYGCELHARVASHVHGIPTVGLRFFNVYGPRQDPRSPYSGVISIFCERIRRGAPIDIFGDGGQTRDFVYVADVVDGAARGDAARARGRAGVQCLHRHRDLGAGPGARHRRAVRHAARCAPPAAARRRDPPLHRLARVVAQDARIARAGERCATASARCWTGWAARANRTRRGPRRPSRVLVQGSGDRLAGAADLPDVCRHDRTADRAALPAHRPLPGMVRRCSVCCCWRCRRSSGFLLAALERDLPLTPPPDQPPQAIVILGGDTLRGASQTPIVHLGPLSLERVRAGALLARRTGLPILVTGGRLRRVSNRRSPR